MQGPSFLAGGSAGDPTGLVVKNLQEFLERIQVPRGFSAVFS